jgi:hypothetical protein
MLLTLLRNIYTEREARTRASGVHVRVSRLEEKQPSYVRFDPEFVV